MGKKKAKQNQNTLKPLVTFAIIAVVIGGIFGYKIYKDSSATYQVDDLALERTKGSPTAKLDIVEFIDFQCPACAQGSAILSQYIKEYPNLIRLELKYFPLSGHKHGYQSALYAECAAHQGKFWAMHDKLLDQQSQWSRLNDAKPAFDLYAQEIGLNSDQLKACLAGGEARSYIDQTKKEGTTLGIRLTPSYLINGKLFAGVKSLQLELNKALQSKP